MGHLVQGREHRTLQARGGRRGRGPEAGRNLLGELVEEVGLGRVQLHKETALLRHKAHQHLLSKTKLDLYGDSRLQLHLARHGGATWEQGGGGRRGGGHNITRAHVRGTPIQVHMDDASRLAAPLVFTAADEDLGRAE